MNNIIRIKIEHVQQQENYQTPKETFWIPFQNDLQKRREQHNRNGNRPIESYESSLEQNFGNVLSDSLINYFSKAINRIQFNKENYSEDSRNILHRNDVTYRDALNKSILASQIIIKVNEISYGSLSLGIIIEPIDKFLDIFDNNFDLMRLFFESYVPPAFIETIKGNYSYENYIDLRLSYNYEFPEYLRKSQQQNQVLLNTQAAIVDESKSNKIDRTKWMTGLIMSPMLFPFILALIILYYYSQKLDSSNSAVFEQSNSILKQKEDVIKAYKELIEQYKSDRKQDTVIINK